MNAPKHTLGTKSGTIHYMKTLRVVPGAGLEPARSCDREILSLLCIPISPPGLKGSFFSVGLVNLHYSFIRL